MPAKVVSIANAEHYMWGSNCDGWHLVKTADLSVIEERMPPGTSEVRHHHIKARQFFFVLEGQLTLEVEFHEFVLKAGEGIEVAPGQAHQAKNQSAADAWFVVTSQPPSHGDRVEG
jgi:mannose-6-phosphate isomerase-like protein (cupin superfamily)